MRLPSPAFSRAAAVALCLAAIAGCASKNPLIDEAPAVAASQPATSPAEPTKSEPQASAAPADSAAQAAAAAESGVHTSYTRRFLGIFSPYRVDVQQGNFVSQEMLAQLKEGMTQEQVQFALGTPLLRDIFHANRWDYLFRLQKRNGEVTTSRVSVFFDNKRLVRYEGGNLPTEQEYLAQIAGTPPKAQSAAEATPKAPSSAKE
ncbi:MAG: outer membrane protein assembly factor BamE [Burkholderiaceae bacterium]